MKKIYLVLLIASFSIQGFAQQTDLKSKSKYIPCSHFGITKPLSEIFANFDESSVQYKHEESEDREHRRPHKFKFGPKDGYQYDNDSTIIQKEMGTIPAKAPILNIAGQTASGFRPYDPSGAAGPNHYVQMINSTTFRVYNKTSGAILLTGTLGNLWSPAVGNSGDPIVLYDKTADRWFLAQFGTSTDKRIYIAISTTNDPTGSYYTYTYVSPAFPDYLKFSVWHDGYYMTSNQTQKVFAFERSAMLAGTPTAKSLYVSFSPPQGSGFFCPLPGDASDGTLPTSGPCPIFSYSDDGWGAGFTDAINIYNMSVNWAPTTPTGTITSGGVVPTSAFNAQYVSTWDDCPQPGTTQKLDGIGGVLMYRAQWKPWSGYNTVVLNWGVYLSASQRSIMWCELRQDQSSGVWSLYQNGIYTPDAATRWMGSIAMDMNGSIGLAYVKSDATSIYPSLCYAGRRSCDPLGTLPIAETVAISGVAYQTGTNRFGDYAHTCLDPDGVTFWHTGEYFGGTNGSLAARTQIFSFQLANCGNTANVNIAVSSGTNPSCTGSSVTFTATPTNGGTTPSYQWQVNGANVGTNSPTYTTSSLTNGQIVTCVMTSSIAGIGNNPATSNGITMTINTPVAPSISISANNTTICPGSSVTFTASIVNGGSAPIYQWKKNGVNVGTNSSTFTTNALVNGDAITCTLTSNSTCTIGNTANSNSITITVSSAPTPSISISASTTILCNIPSVTFTATTTNGGSFPSYQWKLNGTNVGTNSSTYTSSTLLPNDVISCVLTTSSTCPNVATLGTGTTYNASTSDAGAFYPTYYGSGRQQYLIRSSELTALGLSAGNMTSLGVTLNSTLGNPATLNGYTIKIANTASTALTTTFEAPTFTTVYGPNNYTPVLSTINTMNFVTPFYWNGSSNILVDICFSNQVVGTAAYGNLISTAAFNASSYYQADGTAGAGACTTTTGVITASRPNFIFSIAPVLSATSNSITMTGGGNITPSVSINASATAICSGTSVTFTATPTNGGTPSYQWKVNGTNVGTNSNTFTSTTLTNSALVTCDMTSSLACASPSTVTSNTVTMTVNPVVTPSISITATATTICAGTSVTFTAAPTNGGLTPSFQWKLNGNNVGTNSSTYTTTGLSNSDQVSCVLTSSDICPATPTANSNTLTMVVNLLLTPSITIAASANSVCPGTSVTFTASPVNGGTTPSYQWMVNGINVGTNSASYTSTSFNNGDIVTCTLTSNVVCVTSGTANSNAVTMVIYSTAAPTVSITTSANPSCGGNAITFTASVSNPGNNAIYQWKLNGSNVGTNSSAYSNPSLTNNDIVSCQYTSEGQCPTVSTLGTATTTNASNSNNGAFFPTANGNGRQQYLIRASELTAAGFVAGNMTSLGVNVSSTTVGNPVTLNNYTVKMASTSNLTTSTTFINPTFTSVFGPTNYTPTVSSINTLNFSTPFYWNGSSNVIIDICFSNQVTGATAYRNNYSTIAYNAATYYQVQGATTTVCSQATGTTTTRRPNFTLKAYPVSVAVSNSITMSINPVVTPSLVIAVTSGSNPSCNGANVTFTATATNGGTSPMYQWKVNGVNAGTNSPSFSSSTLINGDLVTCDLTSNAPCASVNTVSSNSISMTVNPNVTPGLSIIASSTSICSGTSVNFSASPSNGGTPSYQWTLNGNNVGTNSSTFSSSTLNNTDVITCVMTSNALCASPSTATSNALTMTVNPVLVPAVSITASATTICSGTTVNFSASPSNGGTPSYQWTLNGNNVGTNSSTFSSSTLNNTDVITCVMTSNALCASPSTATSNALTMTVNALPIVSAGTYPTLCSGAATINLVGIPSGGVFSGIGVTGNTFNPTTAGTFPINYYYIDPNGCSGSSNTNIAVINCSSSLLIKVLGEGYYIGSGSMINALYNQGVDPIPSSGVTDSITVELHEVINPFALAYSFTGIWQTNGNILCSFPGSAIGNTYYIVLRHRNTLVTWSANPITLGLFNFYDFSDAANKAYGNNQAPLGSSLYGLITGDISQDQTVDAFDYIQLDAELSLGVSGYTSSDLNGDGVVDAFDYILLDNNLLNGLSSIAP